VVALDMRRAAKIDANQQAIVAALEAAGCAVQSLAGVGQGVPDLLVWRPVQRILAGSLNLVYGMSGRYYLIECKAGSGFTPAQKKWHASWPGPAHVANSVDEALLIVGAK
jgi:hypothetical protein